MEDKLAKVRAEIERQYNEYITKDSELAAIRADECLGILSFIDSIQEEPKKCMYTKDNYTDEDRKILCDGCMEDCRLADWLQELHCKLDSLSKEDFEKVWAKYHQKEEPVSEDLGEYISELSKQFPEVSFAKLSRIAVRVAKWQEQQIMKDAMEGVITFDYYGDGDKTYGCVAHDSFCLEERGLRDCDKVKIIVVKEG